MNNEQLEIERRFGKNQPFKVPEGYFDRLAADVMANIPEQKPVATVPLSWWRRLRPVAVAAACAHAVHAGAAALRRRQYTSPLL